MSEATPPLAVRRELGRFAALSGLSGIAVAQPLLDVFGQSAETFVARNATSGWIWLFALALGLGPPTLLWAATFGAGIAPKRRDPLVEATIAAAGGIAALVLIGRQGWNVLLAIGAGLVVAALLWVYHRRTPSLARWLRLLALLPILAMGQFLFGSEAGDLRGGLSIEPVVVERVEQDSTASEVDEGPEPLASVLWVVLDELPTKSIVGEDGSIDAVRFPNLAAFADESTWYRNATTMAGWTRMAVPSMLTGREPTNRSPVATSYPNNIFRILAGSHHLTVSESLTDLCGCDASVPPPTPVTDEVTVDFPEPPAEKSVSPADAEAAQFGGLLDDAWEAWKSIAGGDAAETTFGDFTEEVVAITTTTSTVAAETTTSALAELPGETLPPDTDDERQDLAQIVAQPERFGAFLDALRPADVPTFSFFHLVLPHHPWQFWPDGTAYSEASTASGVHSVLFETEWDARLNEQRHLLQATYADALLGRILDQARSLPNYDDMLVIVSADHGISFGSERLGRVLSEQTAADIMWTPMFIRTPEQATSATDDSNVSTIDIVPTVLDVLGLVPPWEFDGAPIGSEAQTSRDDTKRYFQFRSFVVNKPDATFEFDGAELAPAALRNDFPAVASTEDPVAGLYRSRTDAPPLFALFEPTASGSVMLRLDEPDDAAMITGEVVGAPGRDLLVVAGQAGQVIGWSPIYARPRGTDGFALLLPQGRVGGPVDFALFDPADGSLTAVTVEGS